jgi:hypothetical protein
MTPGHAAILGLVCTLLAIPTVAAAQGAPMATGVLGMKISWDECKSRVSAALAEHAHGSLRDFGNGWLRIARGQSASVACIYGSGETVVVITTAGSNATGERDRLFASVRNVRTVVPGSCKYVKPAQQTFSTQRQVFKWERLPATATWFGVGNPKVADDYFLCCWAPISERSGGTFTFRSPSNLNTVPKGSHVVRSFDDSRKSLGECAFEVR